MKNPELNRAISEKAAVQICINLSIAIESAIFIQNGESIVYNIIYLE